MKDLGKKIAHRRKSLGFSQEELADTSGINLRTVQRIESGVSEPHGNTIRRLCKSLDLTIEDVYEYMKEENRQYLAMMYLSVLIFWVIPLGNIILPLILWINNKNRTMGVNQHGKEILNFQISWTILNFLPVILFCALPMIGSLDLRFLRSFGIKEIVLFWVIMGIINVAFAVIGAIMSRRGRRLPTLSIPFFR